MDPSMSSLRKKKAVSNYEGMKFKLKVNFISGNRDDGYQKEQEK